MKDDAPLTFTQQLTLTALPPLNFSLSAEIFANGDKQIRSFENGRFRQVIRVNSMLILATVESVGTVDQPLLSAELKSASALSMEHMRKAEEIIRALFNLDFDLKPFYEEVKHDKIMARITRRLWGLKSSTTQTVFEALVDSIVEQQISLRVANTLENRMIKKFGDSLTVHGEVYYAYPTPKSLATASVEALRECGLSQRKAEYIKEVATLVAEGKLDLEKFKNYNDTDEIIRQMDAIRGIGVWTAELTMIRSMQKWDALPADDLGLRRVIAHYYRRNEKITSAQAREIAQPWGKWKGIAAYYLVVAEMLGVEA
ncbi:DNA-3-methyladenine glycosylase 2 family protein [Candidatus Bathyarchaeota archaeon A05DMB-2]|nr:DNA-3-methyladenine glycosylase 2 family protein [Candidatus Bathyarchaeota archaeon A05DMB-2]